MENLPFVFFTLKVEYKDGAKIIKPPVKHQEIKRTVIGVDDNAYAISFFQNTKYNNNKYIICVDVDIKHGGNGLEFMKKYREEIETIEETTQSGGKHLYFYMNENEYNEYIKVKTGNGAIINNGGYTVDVFVNGGFVICAPTKNYTSNYPLSKTAKIQHIPKSIYNLIYEEADKRHREMPPNAYLTSRHEFIKQCEVNDIKELLEYIDIPDNYDEFRQLTKVIKNLNNSEECYKVFNDKCRLYKGYNEVNNFNIWRYAKVGNISIASMFYYIRKCGKTGNNKILKKYSDINTEYITSYKFESKYVGESEVIQDAEEDWKDEKESVYNFDIFAIKSPYGSGKTYLLRDIIKSGKFQKIAYISYRRTLEQQIYKDFEDFKFTHYLEGENLANVDRLIIQIDSILKMGDYYDLLILDELESVLNHITSSLIEKEYLKAQKIFNKLREVCDNSKKIICLDGDMHIRSEDFIKSIDKTYRIYENTIKPLKRTCIEVNDIDIFVNAINKALDNGEKIVIVSQSSKKAKQYFEMVKKKTDKVEIYTGTTDDLKKKEALKNIETWKNLNCLIYTPTIESGVNFDFEHFDRMFINACSGSCSYRSLNQMEQRVRYYTNNETMIYINNRDKGGNYEFSFNEIKEDYKQTTEKKEDELKPFDILKIHNRREEMNNMYCLFHCYKKMGKAKNKEFVKYEGEKMEGLYKVDKIKKIKPEILNEKVKINIEDLLKKQKNGEATEDDKERINKYIICYHLGLNRKSLTDEDKEQVLFYADKISNIYSHLSITDDKYIKNYLQMVDDGSKYYDIVKQHKKISIIREMLKTLGIDNIYERKEIKKEAYDGENMINLINDYKTVNMDKRKTSGERILLTLNSILSNYLLNIDRKRVKNGQVIGYKYTFGTIGKIEEVINQREAGKLKIGIETEEV